MRTRAKRPGVNERSRRYTTPSISGACPAVRASHAKAGSSLGAGAFVFMDDTTCLVNVSMRLVDFYHHESCGKCVPCREGTYFESQLMHRLERGEATRDELATLADICDNMNGKCFCPLGDTATWFVMSAYKFFREEFEAHCGAGRCPVRRARTLEAVSA